MDLSIIVISYNTKGHLQECMNSLRNSSDKLEKEIIVVDNGSSDGSSDMVKNIFPYVKLIENKKNLGFARANNQAFHIAQGRYLLLVNSDCFVFPDTIQKTCEFINISKDCGILGCRLVYPDGRYQISTRYFPTLWRLFALRTGLSGKAGFIKGIDSDAYLHECPEKVDWIHGCYFLIRREVLEAIKSFDEAFFMYTEDMEFCFRAKKKGWNTMFYPGARATHIMQASTRNGRKSLDSVQEVKKLKIFGEFIYFKKHYGMIYLSADLLLFFLANMIQIVKKLLLWRRNISILEKVEEMGLVFGGCFGLSKGRD